MTEEFQKNKEKAKELYKQLDEIQESLTNAVIIDGVNVAGCEYYKGKCMEYTHYCQIGCKECTDIGTKLCHYKQTERFKAKIARLEQENNSLQAQLNNITVQSNNVITALEQENKELKAYKDVNEDFKKAWDELNKKYTEVLKLAKENADSNEYCLQELEKENKELKKQIESQKGLITVGGKQQYEMTKAYDKCKTALEEIRDYLYTLTTVDTDFVNTETYLRINDKIEDVLNS